MNVNFRFDGRRCLVTGAGKGIGRECVLALVRGGADVFALSRTKADLDSLWDECKQESLQHLLHVVCVELSDWAATRRQVEACLPISLLVNNAGIGSLQSFLDVSPDVFDTVQAVNVKALINVSQAVAGRLVADGCPGSIVNVSSQASTAALENHTSYAASKGAVDSITRVMALELGPKNIRVNAVNPTVVMTPMGRQFWTADKEKGDAMLGKIPLGRFAEVEDVVNPILFLLSDGAKMIHGATIPVDGGFLAC